MGFDVLKNISIKKVKHWIRKDLNQKFIEVVHELIISKEKILQLEKNKAELEDEVRRLKGEQARPKFKGKKKIKKRDTSELDHDDDDEDPPAPKKKSIPVDKEVEVDVDQKDLPKDARDQCCNFPAPFSGWSPGFEGERRRNRKSKRKKEQN